MKTWYGYTGKILDVDLSSAILSEAELDPCLANDYMGGKGFGVKILFDQLPPRCEPLSADNILVFATGPLTGTLLPASAFTTRSMVWAARTSNARGSQRATIRACVTKAVVSGSPSRPAIESGSRHVGRNPATQDE